MDTIDHVYIIHKISYASTLLLLYCATRENHTDEPIRALAPHIGVTFQEGYFFSWTFFLKY